MNQDNLALHLSNISTIWTVLERAHTASRQEAKTAQEQLLERYAPAVYRYLLGALRDKDAAVHLSGVPADVSRRKVTGGTASF
jgi:hypothetical protein